MHLPSEISRLWNFKVGDVVVGLTFSSACIPCASMKRKVNEGKKNKEKKVHVHVFVLLICRTVSNIQWQIWGTRHN